MLLALPLTTGNDIVITNGLVKVKWQTALNHEKDARNLFLPSFRMNSVLKTTGAEKSELAINGWSITYGPFKRFFLI